MPAYKNTAFAALALASLLALSACGSSPDASAGQAPASDSATTSPNKDGQKAGATRQEGRNKPATSSSSSSEPAEEPSSSSEPAEEAVITIKDYAYDGPSSVSAGATVTVTNEDDVAHTVTDDDGSFDVNIAGGATESFTAPDEPGDYAFHCTFHSNMTATLTVG